MTNPPARYRKRPVVIEAMHWNGTARGAGPIINWILAGDGTATYRCDEPGGCPSPAGDADHHISIQTLEGHMKATSGDWIVCGVKGEFYPVKPDIFAATYEPAQP